MPSDRIVVTGATGFIGRHLVERLAGEGTTLTLAVRDPQKCPDQWRRNSRTTIVETPDLTRSDVLMSVLEHASSIVHLAGLTQVAQSDVASAEAQFMQANAEVTRALAEASSRSGVTAFVNLSSVHAVDANATERIVDDCAPPKPTTPYGRSKQAAEEYVGSLAAKGVFAISLRPPLVVGAQARGNWGMLQRLAHTGTPLPFGSISNQRSFVGIDSLCDAISALVSQRFEPRLSGNYCIADEETLALPDVIRELRHGMGLPSRLIRCPPAIFDALGQLTGRRRQLAALTGNLRIDASRFLLTFSIKPSMSIRAAIRESGAAYAAIRRRHPTERFVSF